MLQQWHPDRWTRTPSLLGEANHKFQQIQEAYSGIVFLCMDVLSRLVVFVSTFSFCVIEPVLFFGDRAVLSDPKKRTMYDAGMYDPQEEEDEVRASEI